jgi:hypothetical protein
MREPGGRDEAAVAIRLNEAQLERLADLVAERLDERRVTATALVGVRGVAAYLGVEASWVYDNAAKLGVRRLGDGPKARLRFSLADVDASLPSGPVGGALGGSEPAQTAASQRMRQRRSVAPVGLLPIRGRVQAVNGLGGAA